MVFYRIRQRTDRSFPRERPGVKHLKGFQRIRKPGPHSSKHVILVYSHVKRSISKIYHKINLYLCYCCLLTTVCPAVSLRPKTCVLWPSDGVFLMALCVRTEKLNSSFLCSFTSCLFLYSTGFILLMHFEDEESLLQATLNLSVQDCYDVTCKCDSRIELKKEKWTNKLWHCLNGGLYCVGLVAWCRARVCRCASVVWRVTPQENEALK